MALLVLVAGGLTYRFVLRKPAPSPAPIIDGPLSAQPATPAPSTPAAEPQPTATPEPLPPRELQEAAGEGKSVVPAIPAPAKPAGSKTKPAPAPPPPAYQEAHQNAEQALYASRFLEPPEDSALFWARKAKALGDPAADPIEQQVFDKQMAAVQGAMQARDFEGARAQASQLTRYFPDRAEAQQMPEKIRVAEQIYNKDRLTKRFPFRHRHVAGFMANSGNQFYFCTGTLSVTPDGAASFDCASTNDPQGRCDHVAFPPGILKEAKLKSDGSLHLASRQTGNYDFYGDANVVQQALAAIAPLVKH